jgi:hypothetical protein
MTIALSLLLGAGPFWHPFWHPICSPFCSPVRTGSPQSRESACTRAIPHPRTAPDKVEERRSCAVRARTAGSAAYAALADGVLERARMGALDLRRGASDLTFAGIDGLMDDQANRGGRL